jgi:hypothetical protein
MNEMITESLIRPLKQILDIILSTPEGAERDRRSARFGLLIDRLNDVVGRILPQMQIDKDGSVSPQLTSVWRSEIELALAVFWQDA